MSKSYRNKLNINRSSDGSEFNSNIYREMLVLIVEACNMLKADGLDYTDIDEPVISGEIVRFARLCSENQDSPEWAWPYAVHDDPPENDGNRKGKGRKRVDIIIERTQRGKHPRIRFEAKRLKRPGFTSNEYVGKTGLGEFIVGSYAKGNYVAGMLGYIQSDDCDYWAEQIPDALNEKKKEVHLTKDGQWQKANLENVNDCYKTRHNRPTVKRELLVYHLLLDFVRWYSRQTAKIRV